ncbi:MAG: RNA polymerase sigma factor [Clostridia bacterium]|nr:RNA polymerase sigma factor [Clostridia bacterium]MBQ9252167.1 RNA polymerase sigma factor [Clostridia bacterium]
MRDTWLKQAQEGNPEAFELLMVDLEPLVWRICWHYLGNREDASDCGQDAMIKIWRGLPSFRQDCAFESWVYRIAANCCMDFLRKRKRAPVESLEPLREQGFDLPDPGPNTEEETLRREEHARLREAITLLPPDQRDALVLTQLEGRSYEDAAEILETTEGTIKSRVNRARSKLKSLIALEAPLPGQGGAKNAPGDHSTGRRDPS